MGNAIIAMLVALYPALSLAEPQLANVSQAGGIYEELRGVLSTWLGAVLQRDVDTLVGLAAPEARDGVRAALVDDESELTKVLFSETHSVRNRFIHTPKPRIYLFAHPHLTDHGAGTTGCISARPLPEPLPDQPGKLPSSFTADPVFCQFFWRGEGRWYPNYSYGWPDEGGDG